MSLDAALAARAVPHGSMLHYSLLFAPEAERYALTVVHAFRVHMLDIVRSTRETQVAEVKIHWWREELDRIEATEPRHPLGREIATVAHRFDLDPTRFRDMLRAAEVELSQTSITTWTELRHYCHLSAGAAQKLCTAILATPPRRNEALTTFASRLGEALKLTQILRDAREDAHFGRVYLPLDELERRGLTVASFKAQPTAEGSSLLGEIHDRAMAAFRDAISSLDARDHAAQTPGLILAALHEKLLEKMKQRNFDDGQRKMGLSPPRKLWIAWRTARRAALGKAL